MKLTTYYDSYSLRSKTIELATPEIQRFWKITGVKELQEDIKLINEFARAIEWP